MTSSAPPALSTCRACSQLVHVGRSGFTRHADTQALACPGSDRTPSEVDDLLRTFACWENTNEVTRQTRVHDDVDSISLVSTLSVEGGGVEVSTRLEPAAAMRLRDELSLIIERRSWSREL